MKIHFVFKLNQKLMKKLIKTVFKTPKGEKIFYIKTMFYIQAFKNLKKIIDAKFILVSMKEPHIESCRIEGINISSLRWWIDTYSYNIEYPTHSISLYIEKKNKTPIKVFKSDLFIAKKIINFPITSK